MTILLHDEFDGSGGIDGHVPTPVNYAAAAWTAYEGGFTLAGGRANADYDASVFLNLSPPLTGTVFYELKAGFSFNSHGAEYGYMRRLLIGSLGGCQVNISGGPLASDDWSVVVIPGDGIPDSGATFPPPGFGVEHNIQMSFSVEGGVTFDAFGITIASPISPGFVNGKFQMQFCEGDWVESLKIHDGTADGPPLPPAIPETFWVNVRNAEVT